MFAETGAISGFPRSAIPPPMARSDKSAFGKSGKNAKRGPGRERVNPLPPRYPKQTVLKERRLEAGYSSLAAFAEKIGLSTSYYAEIERGDTRLNADTANKIGGNLQIGDIFGVAENPAAAIKVSIGVALGSSEWDRPEPWEMAQMTKKLQTIRDCFAAEIADESADRDHSPGTVLYLRPIIPGEAIPIGSRIVARFFDPTTIDRDLPVTSEILYGLLDRTSIGDLVLLTRSKSMELPASKVIRAGSQRLRDISDQILSMIPRAPSVEYVEASGDLAVIIGLVVGAIETFF